MQDSFDQIENSPTPTPHSSALVDNMTSTNETQTLSQEEETPEQVSASTNDETQTSSQEKQVQVSMINLLQLWEFYDMIAIFQCHKIEIEHIPVLSDAFLTYILQGFPLHRIIELKTKLTEFVCFFIYIVKAYSYFNN